MTIKLITTRQFMKEKEFKSKILGPRLNRSKPRKIEFNANDEQRNKLPIAMDPEISCAGDKIVADTIKEKFTEFKDNLMTEKASQGGPSSSPKDLIGSRHLGRTGRRQSVCAETYNPADDNLSDIECIPKTVEQRQTILKSLQEIFLFRCQEDNQKNMIVDALGPRPVKADEVLIKQGDEGDFFYLIDSGTFEAVITDTDGTSQVASSYDNHGCFGELALMYNEHRAATVKATSDGFLWALSGRSFRRLILRSAYEKRTRYEKLLQQVKQLEPLNSYERNIVTDAFQPRSFGAGAEIFHQGDAADGMYFIEEGEISISVEARESGTDEEICRLMAGGFFGELALVTKQARAATATSVTLSKLAFLDVGAFERLLGPCVDLLKKHIEVYDQSHSESDTEK